MAVVRGLLEGNPIDPNLHLHRRPPPVCGCVTAAARQDVWDPGLGTACRSLEENYKSAHCASRRGRRYVLLAAHRGDTVHRREDANNSAVVQNLL